MSDTPRTDEKRHVAKMLGWNEECVWEWAMQLERDFARTESARLHLLQRAEQSELALAEARRDALEEAAKVCEASSGVNAIPETNAYANGWNDCRKEAFDARQRSAAAIRAMREPK
jgi:hypothetical protein